MSGLGEERWSGARIGILGGTFDPPHAAHVRMGAVAREALALDRVFYSAAPHPPHKREEPVTPWEHRRAMLAAALADEPGLEVTDIECAHDPSYTVDLLRAAAARAAAADLYFIAGADSLASFAAWCEPRAILSLCTLVVFPRGDGATRLALDGPAMLVVFDSPHLDVSSTALRAALESGSGDAPLLPAPVVAYIARHRLYRRA